MMLDSFDDEFAGVFVCYYLSKSCRKALSSKDHFLIFLWTFMNCGIA